MDEADTTDVIDEAGLNPANGAGAQPRAPGNPSPEPDEPQGRLAPEGFREPPPWRAGGALVCRMARLLKDEALAAHYAGLLDREGVFLPLERSPTRCRQRYRFPHYCDPAPRRPADASPEKATRGDVQKLMSVGLTDQDVVTLTGLIAFVNYQARVVTGLRMLKGE